MRRFGLLRFELIYGIVLMTAAVIGLPVGVYCIDPKLFEEPLMLVILGAGMLFFLLVGGLGYVRRYVLYKKTPEVLAEYDDKYLYLYGKKKAKIPLAKLTEVTVDVDTGFIIQASFLRRMIIHLLSDQYGDLVLDIDGFGTYKLRFVSQVEDTSNRVLRFLDNAMNAQ